MRCIRVSGAKEPLVFLDKEPIPSALEGGAVVKITYSGVCHTDVHLWEGSRNFMFPRVPGHEIAGVVFSIGDNPAEAEDSEADIKVGDPVLVYPWIFCNSCRPCKAGRNLFCDGSENKNIGTAQDGGFADYVSVPELRCLVPFPESIPPAVSSLLPCSGLTGYNAVEQGIEFVKTVAEVKGGCSVLVIGAGGVSQWGLRLARALYPPETQIMCADVKQEALDSVVSNVKDVTPLLLSRDQSSEHIAQQVKAASYSGDGVDLVLDFVGATQTFEFAIKSLKMRGRFHVVGLFHGEAKFALLDVILKQIVIQGIRVGSRAQLKRLLDLVANTPSLYDNLQYKVYPLEDCIQIMEKLAKGQVVGRAVLKCAGDD